MPPLNATLSSNWIAVPQVSDGARESAKVDALAADAEGARSG